MSGSLIDVGTDLLGPHGGALALSFGAGCAATYAFLLTTTIKSLVAQVTEWKGKVKETDARCDELCGKKDDRIKELEHMLLFESLGNNRQRVQLVLSEQSNPRRKSEAKGARRCCVIMRSFSPS
jgi:hypothetical protein